uniref:Uncharacterized protein n=1 Tax=Anguilla anguilla TaxID=7936 RepID=A0A0E9SYA7_ANGAN
MSKLRLFHKV